MRGPTRAARLLAAVAVALGVAAVPIERVFACDCARTDVATAIADADAAFVGTLVAVDGAGKPPAGVAAPTRWTWNVERSRSADDPPTVTVAAVADDGANCGITFGEEPRWLVVAYLQDGELWTNGCAPNTPVQGAGPDVAAAVDALVPVGAESEEQAGPSWLSGPVVPVILGVLLLVGVSAFAFRRERVS